MPQSTQAVPSRIALVALERTEHAARLLLARTERGFELPSEPLAPGQTPAQGLPGLLERYGLAPASAPVAVRNVELDDTQVQVFVVPVHSPETSTPHPESPARWWRRASLEEAFHVLYPEVWPMALLAARFLEAPGARRAARVPARVAESA